MIIQRDLYTKIASVIASPEAIVITGMRRVGKTTLLKHIFERIKSSNKLYLDLENPRNQRYFLELDYDAILTNLELLGVKKDRRAYIFLDEIQSIKQLSSVVKYLMDTYKIKFILSGSSSFYLKNQFSESLAGRKYIFELYPLTFGEFLRMKEAPQGKEAVIDHSSVALYYTYKAYMDEYIQYGGFPGVVQKTTKEEKKAALDDIFSSYYRLEVLQLSDFRKSDKMRDLLYLLMERTGSRLDVSKLASTLGIARETINGYIAFLEGTYFIKTIRPFTTNKDVELRKAAKVYVCDHGLVRRCVQVDEGALFENAVYWNLQQNGTVMYYQKKGGSEIDFIFNNTHAFEVKSHPHITDVRKLNILAQGIGIKTAHVVGREYIQNEKVMYLYSIKS